MAEDYTATIRIRRPAKVTTDERGRSVWAGEVETAELELVSTEELEQLLAGGDRESRTAIERALAADTEGVLARDPATGLFQVVSEEEVEAALRQERSAREGRDRPEAARGGTADELSLVSTQVLRRRLDAGSAKTAPSSRPAGAPRKEKPARDDGGGFDPYNSG